MRCTIFADHQIEGKGYPEWYHWECGCSYVCPSPVRSAVRYYAKRHLEGAVSQVVSAYRDRLGEAAAASLIHLLPDPVRA